MTPIAFFLFDTTLICMWSMINLANAFQVCAGRERFGGFGCYDVIVQPGGVTWYDANEHCADLDKALLAIETQEENDAVNSYLQQNEGKLVMSPAVKNPVTRFFLFVSKVQRYRHKMTRQSNLWVGYRWGGYVYNIEVRFFDHQSTINCAQFLGRNFILCNEGDSSLFTTEFMHISSWCTAPFAKSNGRFFQKYKLTWCLHPICTNLCGCIKCMQVFMFCAKYIDLVPNKVSVFFQIKFEHHR